jgi:hypothetical protein
MWGATDDEGIHVSIILVQLINFGSLEKSLVTGLEL